MRLKTSSILCWSMVVYGRLSASQNGLEDERTNHAWCVAWHPGTNWRFPKMVVRTMDGLSGKIHENPILKWMIWGYPPLMETSNWTRSEQPWDCWMLASFPHLNESLEAGSRHHIFQRRTTRPWEDAVAKFYQKHMGHDLATWDVEYIW